MRQQTLELPVVNAADIPSNGKPVSINYPMSVFTPAKAVTVDAARRMALLSELPGQFETETRLDDLLRTMLKRLIEAIPGAERGAWLLRDRESDELQLKASISPNGPAVNKVLEHRAMSRGKGFIWRRNRKSATSDSMSGMYAPLVWKGKVLGVICVDTPQPDVTFTKDDLKFMATVARCAAMAIANRQLQEDIRQKSKLLERLRKIVSPNVWRKLLERAHNGPLRPGGKKSEVTILFADLRGFTRMSAGRDPADLVDILSDYFSTLMKPIFEYDGIIDKFIGDAILAVFGSPEPDVKQHKKAVQAAWEMQAAMNVLNAERKARGQVTCNIGIGIHSGEVLHGFIGAAEQVQFTVIGDVVNRASRYCDGAGPGEVLISPEVYQWVYKIVKAEWITIQTKHEGTLTAYRIKDVNLK